MGTRTTPDGYDIVVWKLDEAAAPFINSSTSASAPSHAVSDLATQSGATMSFQQPSPFAASGTNSAVLFSGTNATTPRNFISGANNFEPQQPISISMWINIRAYNNTGFTQRFLAKQHTVGVWSGVFAQVGFQNRTALSASTAWDFFIIASTGGDVTIPLEYTIPLFAWTHIGLTYNGSLVSAYINGVLVGTIATTGSIVYGNHGAWFIGAIPAGSGNPEEFTGSICDIRIANIVRPLSYFQNVYRLGANTSGLGGTYVKYYKLRAFDSSCSTPTAVYWVSTSIDYTDAPTAPCGALGPIEIVESWAVIGD